jgi:hypothetical protein
MRVIALLVALAAVPALAGPIPTATTPQPISDIACLRKMSLDLTHRGPTAAELEKVKTKTATLAQMADTYMASAEFSGVIFDWYRREFPPTSVTPAGVDTEEPARIVRHIVVNDLDFREVMTGNFTVGTDGVSSMQVGKPAAGVLSTRHYMSSAGGLYRRVWAGRFERQWTGIALTATSIPPGPIDITREGIASNPACAGCHVHPVYGIDALAKFADCWDEDGTYDSACTPPDAMFLTRAGQGLPALGKLMAGSKEWKAQTVNFFFRIFFGRGLATSESEYYLGAAKTFESSGFRAKALIKHLVTSPAYCAR